MTQRATLSVLAVTLGAALPCLAQGLWDPQNPGTPMTQHIYQVDGAHKQVVWDTHAGFTMSVDGVGVYDNWRTVDDAPQVRISFDDTSVDLRSRDFVVQAQTSLRPGYGTRFHAGICVVFSGNNLLVWGPHGSTDLRFRQPDGVNYSQSYPDDAVFLKIKRRVEEYSAWYSSDGKNWTRAWTTTVAVPPVAVGTILKTWTEPHAETVDFQYFEITNVQNEPAWYAVNTRYGNSDASALHFVYELSGVDILLRLFINDDGGSPAPEDGKFYLIHATTNIDGDGCYDALWTYQRIVTMLEAGGHPNMVVVAPRFLRNNCPSAGDTHPYDFSMGWQYQNLQAEEDWILLDVHENFTRLRFPATTMADDNRFSMIGHSGGGQYVARFAVGHSDKLTGAVASSPWGTAYPTGEYEWEFGTYLPAEFVTSNPRFEVDLAGARALPLAVVVGENDVEPDRGWTQSSGAPHDIGVLSRSRFDNAMKWVRQMDSSNIQLYIVPEIGHWFSTEKRQIGLDFLFHDPSPHDHLLYSSPAPDFQDSERQVIPFLIPDDTPYYFNFDRFPRDARRIGKADRRYTVYPWDSCFVETIESDGSSSYAWKNCDVTHDAGNLLFSIDEGAVTRHYGGIWANLLYGKLRLYSTDASDTFMLEESSTATVVFIQDKVVGTRLNLYQCSGRGPDGPECGPFPLGAVQLNGNQTIIDPDTGAPPTFHVMRTWVYDSARNLLLFKDGSGATLDFRIGDWRWGEDANGDPFLAGLQTFEDDGVPRRELQTNAIYSPRYFEQWEVANLDYDNDGVTDIVDNCPVTANAGQQDSDGDGLGDLCDDTPVNPPPYIEASDGTEIDEVLLLWYAATGATHYQVWRSMYDDPQSAVPVSSWQTAGYFRDTTVVPGWDYFYWVRSAVSSSGAGASSYGFSDGGWAALAAPTGVTASDGTVPDHVHITWNTVSGGVAYRVRSSFMPDPLSATVLSPWTSATSWNDGSIGAGEVTYYWVEASPYVSGGRNSSLGGPDSGWWSIVSLIFADGFEGGNTAAWFAP